jgi:nucleoside 2-deoxyribosyltransferase-like protein
MNAPIDVFLGGSCGGGLNATRWRSLIAIPRLENAGVTYINPQLPSGEWDRSRMPDEKAQKRAARQLLIVITGDTRGTTSCLEAVEYMLYGGHLHLVIEDIPEGAVFNGRKIYGAELKDLNRMRAHVRDMVAEHQRSHIRVHETIGGAITAIVAVAGTY